MNYPYDQHNTSSQNSRNQFILSQSSLMMNSGVTKQNNIQGNNDIDKIFSYMKNVMSNPMLMDQMEKFLAAKQQQKNSSFVLKQNQSLSSSRMNNEIRQTPQSYGVQKQEVIHKQHQLNRIVANPHAKKIVKTSQMTSNNINRKKSDNGLMAYINIETPNNIKTIDNNKNSFENDYDEQRVIIVKQKQIQKKQQKLPVQSLKPPASFEDMPIKSNYIANKQFDNFDSVQNRLASYPQNSSQFYESSQFKKITNKTTTTSTSTKNNSNNNLEKYVEAQERPINGTRKDFKQLLMQKFGQTPFDQKPIPAIANNSNKWNELEQYDNQNENDQNNQDNKPKRQFLKRGSRQYLSSAKDKKQVKKPVKNKDSQQNLNSSRLGIDKAQRDKTPTKRDVSQNRILSKRNTNNNDKSVSKIKAKDKLNTSNNDSYYDQKQYEEPKRHITPKHDKGNQQNKNSILPPKSNKPTANTFSKTQIPNSGNIESGKKKNVFYDSSSSEEGQQKNEFSNNEQEQQSQINNKFVNGKKSIKNGEKKVQCYQPEKQFNMFSRQKKQEVIEGVYLSKNQLNIIIQRYAPKVQSIPSKSTNNSQQKFNQLRKKYTDLCNLLEKQKIEHQQQMQKEKQQFQIFKQQQIQKLKNQKRVMERQIKSSMPSQSQNLQKDKQQVQNLKKQLEKERQEHKKKEKNNKILIEKYKKENEDMKFRLQKLQQQLQKQSVSSVQNNLSSANSDKQTNYSSVNAKSGSTNDKSKSKVIKDLSPAKNKISKSSKAVQINQDEDKNYQKTIPLYKGQNKSKSSNQNKKKSVNGSKNFDDDNNSEDDKLPTFKVDNKKKQQQKKSVKTHKKYQYIQNSVETTQNKKDSQSSQSKASSNYQSKESSKNVFADESDEQNYHQDEQVNDNSDEQSGHQSGFFKSQPKYQKLSDLMNAGFSIKHVTDEMIQNLLRYDSNQQYSRYLQRVNNPKRIIVNSSKNGVDKKITNIYNDKSKQILFQNGVKKQIFQDGYTIIYFKNGDIKQKLTDGTTLYYFNDKKVDQFTLINGLNIYRFDNNQIQVHYDGNYIEIRHPDGTIKMLGSPIH